MKTVMIPMTAGRADLRAPRRCRADLSRASGNEEEEDSQHLPTGSSPAMRLLRSCTTNSSSKKGL